eukprot:15449222-Alexandrium_andersonii.AAC.1
MLHHRALARPLTHERQPHDTHAAVYDGPLPIVHGYLLRTTGNFSECCDPAATPWPGTCALALSG